MSRDKPEGNVTLEGSGYWAPVLAEINQPVWVVDGSGSIRYTNPAAVAALGYHDPAQLQGRPSHDTIHGRHVDGSPHPAEECPMLSPIRTGEPIHSDEDWLVRQDGTILPVESWSAPITTPAGRGAVVTCSDVGERQRLELVTRQRDLAEARALEARSGQRRIIEAFDALRAQLARDLHDGAQQQFVNTLLYLRRAEQQWLEAPDEGMQLLELAIAQARTGIDGLRELVAGVHPAILTTRGLAAALDVLAGRLPYPLELDLAAVELPATVETSVYFICSEALANVTRHAAALTASLRTVIVDGHLVIEVEKDGVGDVVSVGGGGLDVLNDRVMALGGTLEVTSLPSVPTLRVRIPLLP